MNCKVDFKKKFMATLAMLLIAAMLLTSTTFAWLVLSTAPTMEGVMTNISANGFLEIALASPEVMARLLASDMYDDGMTSAFSTGDLLVDNRRWSNIINLNDTRYGLDSLVLKPSVLNIANGTVQANPLLTATYGYDGRIELLDSFSAIGGYDAESLSYLISKALDYGVRFAGVPHASEVMDNIEKSGQKTRAAAALLLREYSDLLMKGSANLAEGYDTAEMREFLDAVTLLNDQFEETIGYMDALYAGETPDEEEAAMKAKLSAAYTLAVQKLEEADALLRAIEYPPETTTGVTTSEETSESTSSEETTASAGKSGTPVITELGANAVRAIVLPLLGTFTHYYWDVVGSHVEGDQVVADYGWIEGESIYHDNKIVFGEDGYFHQLAVVCGIYSAKEERLTWSAETDELSLIIQLSGESVYEDYRVYLSQYEDLAAQLDGMTTALTKIVKEDYEAAVEFFYMIALPNEKKLENHQSPLDYAQRNEIYTSLKDRVNRLEEIAEFLEEYLRAAVMAYASSGSVDRSVYLKVRAVEANENATTRQYLEAAGLSEGTAFGRLLAVCEDVFARIDTFTPAVEALDYELGGGTYDENGNPDGGWSGWTRYATIEEIMTVWDMVSDVFDMAVMTSIGDFDMETLAENAREVFVRNLKGFEVYDKSGFYARLVALQGELGLYYLGDVDITSYLEEYADWMTDDRQKTEAEYINDTSLEIGVGEPGEENETLILDTINAIKEAYKDVSGTKFDALFQEYEAAALAALETFDKNRAHTALDDFLVSYWTAYIYIGMPGSVYDAVKLARPIVDDLANALKAQVYFWAVGRSMQAYLAFAEAEEDKAEEAAKKGETYEPASADDQEYLIDELLALGEDVTLEALVEAAGIASDEAFKPLYDEYLAVEYDMTSHEIEEKNEEGETYSYTLSPDEADYDAYYEDLTFTADGGAFAEMYSVLHGFADDSTKGGDAPDYEYRFTYKGLPGRKLIREYKDNPDGTVTLIRKYWENPNLIGDQYLLYIWEDGYSFDDYYLDYNFVTERYVPLNYAVSDIETLIDDVNRTQTITQSDRESVYYRASNDMQNAATLAKKYYDLYLAKEYEVYKLIYQLALDESGIEYVEPEFDDDGKPVPAPVGTYTRAQLENFHDAIANLESAYNALEEYIFNALLTKAASDETSEKVFKAALKAESSEQLFSILGLSTEKGGALAVLHSGMELKSDLTYIKNGVNDLLFDTQSWSNLLLKSAKDSSLRVYVNAFASLETMTISGMSFEDYRYLTDHLKEFVWLEDENGQSYEYYTYYETIRKIGTEFQISDASVMLGVHKIFENVDSSKKRVAMEEILVGEKDDLTGDWTMTVYPTIGTIYGEPPAYLSKALSSIRMTVLNEMNAYLAQAKKQARAALANETTLLYTLLPYVLQNAGISPLPNNPDTLVSDWTMNDASDLAKILSGYEDAVDSLRMFLLCAVRAMAAAKNTLLYEETLKTDDIYSVMNMVGISEGNFFYDLAEDIDTLKSHFIHARGYMDMLIGNYASMYYNEAKGEYFYYQNMLDSILCEVATALMGEEIFINETTAAEFAAKLDDLYKQPIPGNNRVPTMAQTLINNGVSVQVKSGALIDYAHLFANKDSYIRKMGTITIGNATAEVDDITLSFELAYGVPKGTVAQAENAVKNIPYAGLPSAGLNVDSYHLLSDVYAFALDFFIRTNATNANLLLQTDPVQRIYGENEQTTADGKARFDADVLADMLGGGSFIEFSVNDPENEEYLAVLASETATEEEKETAWLRIGGGTLEAMCVVFADTITGQVYATARPSLTYYSVEDKTFGASLCLVDEDGNVIEDAIIKPLTTQQVSAVTAWVYLDGTRVDNSVMQAELDTDISINIQFSTDAELKPSIQQIAH